MSTDFPHATRLGFGEHFADLAAGELQREREGLPPTAQVRALAATGYAALRLPPRLGGRGISIRELVELTVELGSADSHAAHALRNAFLFAESAMLDEELHARWLPGLAAGQLVGLGFGEAEMPRAGAAEFLTSVRPEGSGFVLDGVKLYSTGNAYCDLVLVQAREPDGEVAHVVVPVDREGVEILDDWDGIGQRFTASGTTRFHQVRVEAEEVLTSAQLAARPSRRSTERASPLAQVYLTAVVAGIVAGAAREAVGLVVGRGRNYYHGTAEKPRDDAMVQAVVGKLSADAFAARATVLAAAESLDAALEVGTTAALEAASFDAARAKVVVDEIATRATAALLDAGSASAIRSGLALDRFWRNARTLVAHNPTSYKQRVIGDHLLNSTPPPNGSFF